MGVVNVTPDSFSDGGDYFDAAAAVEHGHELVAQGADLLDVGGESTRPGAPAVGVDEELRRVLPVVRALARAVAVPVSIDTTKSAVAAAAVEAGAAIVNDVSGGTADADMLHTVARIGAGYVVMHMRGTPQTMQDRTDYDDVVRDVSCELRTRVQAAIDAGVDPRGMLADPGIGFAKTAAQNLALLRALPELAASVGVPLLVGASRKSFLGQILGDVPPAERDWATLATTVWGFVDGVAVVRVHAVDVARRAADLLDVMERATSTGMAA
jgi:dihydropteroate synthase